MSDEKELRLLASSSPHVHSGESVRGIMFSVILALTPAFAAALVFFGVNALRLVFVCVACCVAAEALSRKIMKRDAGIWDMSAVVTGMLLAFNLPPGLPTWMAAVGSVAAIILGKQIYGGIGYNPFNPALVGRAILLLSCPAAMTAWMAPQMGRFLPDAVTSATPLGVWKTACSAGDAPLTFFNDFPLADLILGNRPGCLGETSAVALLIGASYLLLRRCIRWETPFAFIGSVLLFAGMLYRLDPETNLNPLYHVLTGGLLLGAFFMATDMVTTPVTRPGLLVFGVGCGILTMVIRKWGGYPEGVSFAILIMNAVTPLINRATRPRVFGHAPAVRKGTR